MKNKLKILYITVILLFLIPVNAAVGWGTSDVVYLSSVPFLEDHTGSAVSELVFLSSWQGNTHVGYATSGLVSLSSLHYGDIDNNGEVESMDASLILQYTVNIDPAPSAPLPWEDWRFTVADVSGDGIIGSYDAALILRYAINLIDIFPVEGRMIIDFAKMREMKLKLYNSINKTKD